MPTELIPALQKDDALLKDIQRTASEREAFHLWWLGQSGYLIQWQGHYLLIDPYLSDSLTHKYARTEKPHIRMSERVVDPSRLNFIDVVTSSHNHTDHLDGETLRPLFRVNPDLKLVIPEANRAFVAERLEIDADLPVGLNDGESVTVADFTLHAVPAAHETVERDEAGRCRFLGYIIQFGPYTVYHSGDTLRYEGMVEQLALYDIDVALLPINGRAPERRVAGNLNAEEAVRLAREINARTVIPCHYDMFTFNTANPDDFVQEAEVQGQPYQVLRGGERWSSYQLPPVSE
jgi:L-ascorbate metabolism protein UlaG (beta-lactamase superfamily)